MASDLFHFTRRGSMKGVLASVVVFSEGVLEVVE
jgi:hypothetical protein